MPPKIERNDAPVVNIDSSDDENGTGPGTSNACSSKTPSQSQARPQLQPQLQLQNSYALNSPSSVSNNQTHQSRSFWKAGDYVVGPISKPAPAEGHLEHARVHPKFLHSNATSHKWAFGGEYGGRGGITYAWLALCFVSLILINLSFGDTVARQRYRLKKFFSNLCCIALGSFIHAIAKMRRISLCIHGATIAELLDNAVDEIQNGATFVKVDKLDIMTDNSPALLFLDDGGGMDPEAIRKCMSLGYSSKKSKTTIGQYGNGFKTSTMRLGADVIVFSRATHSSRTTQSVGLLSYTFLRKTGQDDVIVPMIDFDLSGHWAEPIIYSSQEDWSENLKTILDWSPFESKEELMLQFEDIGSHGTKILIYNLWLNDEGIYELSFDDDAEDIRLRDEANRGAQTKLRKSTIQLLSHISYRIRYSLRAYASILYLRKFPNFKIVLRGKPVDWFDITEELKYSKVVTYRPQLAVPSNDVRSMVTVNTTIGFLQEAPSISVSGYNVYHKNRLIKPFWKVTADGSSKGNGVVGVLEVNFIEPAHDKQDFERSLLFIRLEARLKQMIMEYWKGHCHLVGYQPPNFKSQKVQKEVRLQSLAERSNKNHNELPADQQDIGIVGEHEEDLSSDPPIVDLQADGVYFSNNELQVESVETPRSWSADQIREENIKLFVRCEEYMRRETGLKQTVEGLEKELVEIKGKCAELSSLLEAKRRQNK